MTRTILTAEFQHESNTFSRIGATLDSFRQRYWFTGDAAIQARGDANTPLAGFLDVARREGWQVVHPISTGATPSGPVTREAYETIAGLIVDAVRAERDRLDGILLGLHGAMVAEHLEDGEGELLARIRAIVGPDLPIGLTLDPHANVTAAMVRHAQIIVTYKTYPHVDMRERAVQAAEILRRTMAGEIAPVTLRAAPPMLEEVTGGRTDIGPMVARIAAAIAYEQEPDVFAVSVDGGFGNADIAETGPTVLVTCQGDLARHRAFAHGLARDMWDRRHESPNLFLTVEAAAAEARAFDAANGPLVIADYADNPGGGAYGDSTTLLAALLAAGVEDAALGGLVDPEAVAELARHPVGSRVRVALGGKTDPRIGGGPLVLEGELRHLSDGRYVGEGLMIGGLEGSFGPTAVLRVGGLDVLVIANAAQMLDLGQFRAFGIVPEKKRVLAVKSMQHFRAAFEPIAGRVIVCDGGALCSPDLTKLPYSRVRRPIFPLDAATAWPA
ncbi:microcystin degradation protein MlrC [Prosthecomicrobium hirschii]|uniref:Microcystinase C n=1 Tax=Prosthecodimorpha hirschii TaxID=665126 RepID=A0A0P6W7R0_9HYPH|nr:M81 family metallopeptidase [Prosthecomicrobium hirschii]KPL53399.1 microcystin degradation protein MlrC [Prosthecomicrobium hirschii]